VVNTFLFDLLFFRTNSVRGKSLGADPPSRGYGVASEAAPSNIVLIIHAMLQAGGTYFILSQTSVAGTQATSNRR